MMSGMTDTKTCTGCGDTKTIDEFYTNNAKCKVCVRERVARHRMQNAEKIKKYDRERGSLPHRREAVKAYAQTDAGRAARRRASKAYYDRNPEKRAAHVKVGNAIRDGRLVKQPCRCGEIKVEAHHDDYSKPLDVTWLCTACHVAAHRR